MTAGWRSFRLIERSKQLMGSQTLEGISEQELLGPAAQVVDLLPIPNYEENYQPTWPNEQAVVEAVHELQNTRPTTTPHQVDALLEHFGAISTGQSDKLLGAVGRCADRLHFDKRIHSFQDLGKITLKVARDVLFERDVVRLSGNYTFLSRVFNFAKPRTKGSELHPHGYNVPAWQGDNVNGQDINERTPEPSRMVSAALQKRDVMDAITLLTGGEHVPTAHELLLLPQETGMLRKDDRTGKLYSLSADMVWIGYRTNDPEGAHVNLASMLANPIGVKLGPDTTPEQVAALKAKLNPENIPGKLTFLIRMGLDNVSKMDLALAAIAEHAPESLIMYDPHGSTIKNGNIKIRAGSNIIKEIQSLARVCNQNGLPLHGVMLETTPDVNSQECVETPDQLPQDPADVDPLLNPRQFGRILKTVEPALGHKALQRVTAEQNFHQ